MSYYERISSFILLDHAQIDDAPNLRLTGQKLVDLRYSRELTTLDVSNCRGIQITGSYLPPSLLSFTAQYDSVKRVDFHGCPHLQTICMTMNDGVEIVDGFIPASCRALYLAGSARFVDLHGVALELLDISGVEIALAGGFVPPSTKHLTVIRGQVRQLDLSALTDLQYLNMSQNSVTELVRLPRRIGTLKMTQPTRQYDLREVEFIDTVIAGSTTLNVKNNYVPYLRLLHKLPATGRTRGANVEKTVSTQQIDRYRQVWDVLHGRRSVWDVAEAIQKLSQGIAELQRRANALVQ